MAFASKRRVPLRQANRASTKLPGGPVPFNKASVIQQSFRSFAISDRATRSSVWDDSRPTWYGIRIGGFVYRWPWLATDTTFEESNIRWLDPEEQQKTACLFKRITATENPQQQEAQAC